MRPGILYLMIAALTAGPAASTLAADLPSPQLKIVAVEMIDGENVLRLMVRRRIEVGEPPFNFNPANCPRLTTTINAGGKSSGARHHFDLEIGAAGRTAAEQRQLVTEIFTAFFTSLPVTLYVADDSCVTTGSRAVSGIRVRR
ncbi:MAG: hypothetical protein ABR558_02390 [Thioalkalivibrio sp.]